jgi:hypothetical protein
MPQAVESIASELQELAGRIRDLERRVATLEGHTEPPIAGQTQEEPSTELQRPKPPATWRGFPPVEVQGGFAPVIGKAVLGIAGAYLLRALAESGSISKLPVLIVAIVYAAVWMVWAVRSYGKDRFAGIAYAITAALILSPLLWESTVRFEVISPTFAAVVLVGFVVLTLMLAWQRNLQGIPWIATLTTVTTAIALIIATHDVVPLTAGLLAVALATEIAAAAGHRLSLRAFPAIAADFAVWLTVSVMTSSQGVPEGYRPASAITLAFLSFLLLSVYGASIGIRSFVFRQRMSVFEIGQGVLAFALATMGTLWAIPDATSKLGVLFLVLSAVCYWGALDRFADESYSRNRRVSSTWAAALLLGGNLLLFPAKLQTPFLCVAALSTVFWYCRTCKFSLGWHASVYLAAGAVVSTLPIYLANAIVGTVPAAPDTSFWIVTVGSAFCYVVGARNAFDQGKRRLLWVVPAALVSLAAVALAIVATVSLGGNRINFSASRLSVIRTVTICALALGLALLGSRWKRPELRWIAYAVVVLGTLKLLVEDLRFGDAGSLVVSLLFYGLILILLPRLTRPRSDIS